MKCCLVQIKSLRNYTKRGQNSRNSSSHSSLDEITLGKDDKLILVHSVELSTAAVKFDIKVTNVSLSRNQYIAGMLMRPEYHKAEARKCKAEAKKKSCEAEANI